MSYLANIGIRMSVLHFGGIILGFISLFIAWSSTLSFCGWIEWNFFDLFVLYHSHFVYCIALLFVIVGFCLSLVSPIGGIVQLIGIVTYLHQEIQEIIYYLNWPGLLGDAIRIGLGPFVCLFSSVLTTISIFYPFKYCALVILPIGDRVRTIPGRFRERLFIFYRKS